jgi:hypothetical protein
MVELLAIPEWRTTATTVEDWVEQLSSLGGPVVVTRESTGVSWLEVASLRMRGYAVTEGTRVEAINFEITAPDTGPATQVIESAARALGWEVHPDDPDDADADDDD